MVTEQKINGKVMEGEVYYPSEEVAAQARVQDWDALAEKAHRDPEGFWAAEAEELEWFQKWDKVLDDSNKPFFKWFVGAKTNIVHNAIDRHLNTHRKTQLALIWESEDGKLHQTYSYYAMNREVSRTSLAAARACSPSSRSASTARGAAAWSAPPSLTAPPDKACASPCWTRATMPCAPRAARAVCTARAVSRSARRSSSGATGRHTRRDRDSHPV